MPAMLTAALPGPSGVAMLMGAIPALGALPAMVSWLARGAVPALGAVGVAAPELACDTDIGVAAPELACDTAASTNLYLSLEPRLGRA